MQNSLVAKEQSFKLRLDETDRDRLNALAEHYSLSVAGVVRMLVKRDIDALGLNVRPASAPSRKRSGK